MPRALVVRAPGINCDAELVRAFQLAGANVDLIHLTRLTADPDAIDAYDIIGFPGGFSYGDDVASGRVFAMRVALKLREPLKRAAARGCPIIGVCNGFQVLVQVGLLPGPDDWNSGVLEQQVSLTNNASNSFIDEWVRVEPVASSSCIWTQGLTENAPDDLRFPIAHAEGRFYAPDDTLDSLERNGQVALRYIDNVNGSARAIAGICDRSGRVFGLMPHPERFLQWTHHPFWTRLPEQERQGTPPGLTLFKNAVRAAETLTA